MTPELLGNLPTPEQYIEDVRVADDIRATSIGPTTTVGVVPSQEVNEP